MVANTTPCTPLYEPGAPPPPIPLLTAQTDLFDNPFRPTTLVNTEILPKGGPTPRADTSPARVKQVTHLRHRSLSPLTSLSGSDSDASDSDASDSSESSVSESSTDSADGTIPKPPGEPGRPGRGGYTLEDALDWNPKAFKKLKVRQLQKTTIVSNRAPQTLVYDLVNDHLDTTKCYSGQSLQSLRVVCNTVRDLLFIILVLVYTCADGRQVS